MSHPLCDCAGCIALAELEPFGNPRIRTKTLTRNDNGGSVVVQVAAVHTHGCPFWREGKRHGPCTCGALEAWETVYPASGEVTLG